jgi:magnesium transporter
VRWINVDGITDAAVIYGLAEKYGLHPLAIEDVMRVPQRPKAEDYGAEGQPKRLYVIVRMIELVADHVQSEQISIFLGRNTVLTFQESPGDVWDPIRKRLATPGSRLRNGDASFLVYSLVDAIVDQCFPILERYGDRLEELEDQILNSPSGQTMAAVHEIKREILLLRRAVWPMRDVVQTLLREPHENFSEQTRTYMRDVYDHVVHVIDIIETYREVGTALTETYMSSMSNKLNQVMKVLTIITTIFVPLTFLAGVYGMNFTYLPEKDWKMGYPMFWLVSVSLAGGMLYLFRRRGWL